MRRSAAVISACGLIAACGSSDDGRATRERTAQLSTCADAIERAGAAQPGDQAIAVARGCRPACPGLADWLEARAPDDPAAASHRLIAGCYPACAQKLTAAPLGRHDAWASTVEVCGAEALALPAGQTHLASDDWLVLAAVARWLDASVRAGVSDRAVGDRLAAVTATATFHLPLAADPMLPVSRHRRAPRAARVLRLGAEAGPALPSARIQASRVELVPASGVADAGVPLLLADAQTPLGEVLAMIERLGANAAELGVSHATTAAHPVTLERLTSQAAVPSVELAPGSFAIRGFGDDRVTDRARFAAELDHFAAINAPVREVELVAHPGATIGDLVFVMDAAWDARVEVILFNPPAPAPAETPF